MQQAKLSELHSCAKLITTQMFGPLGYKMRHFENGAKQRVSIGKIHLSFFSAQFQKDLPCLHALHLIRRIFFIGT